ncbi:hypothetical protein J6590_080050 [Homalodisca vitripennis]|nr:hypothetical protein J6590_080050 [Homalodisca vitripennis]
MLVDRVLGAGSQVVCSGNQHLAMKPRSRRRRGLVQADSARRWRCELRQANNASNNRRRERCLKNPTGQPRSRYSRPDRKPNLYIAVTLDQPGSRVCTKPLLKTSQGVDSVHSRYSRPAWAPGLYIADTHDQAGSRVCT